MADRARVKVVTIPVLLLASAMNIFAVQQVVQHNESTESAKDAVDRATAKALQGDATSAVKILLDVPASEYSSEDAEWRPCMVDRSERSSKVVEPSIEDPWIAELAQTYLAYWRRSMTRVSDRVDAERELERAVSILAGRSVLNDRDFDRIEEEIATRARAHGF